MNDSKSINTHQAGGHQGEEEGAPEVANFITVLAKSPLKESPVVKFLHQYENPVFSLLIVLILSIIVIKGTKKLSLKTPSRIQNFLEFVVEALRNFIYDILGKKYGRRFLPYVGTLFIFILCNNLFGLIPFMKSPTSAIQTTAALAIITFLYVQYVGITENGIWGYFYHLAGSPQGAVMWALSPIFLVLHIITEFVRPVSLALRLFGNILGEDILLGAFTFMGISLLAYIGLKNIPVGIPLQFPFFFLALISSTVQAVIFSLLATIYFLLALPDT